MNPLVEAEGHNVESGELVEQRPAPYPVQQAVELFGRWWARILRRLAADANVLERVSLLAALGVLLTGLFYRTVHLELQDESCRVEEGCDVLVVQADGVLRVQLMAVDVVCVSVVVLSTLYVGMMSVVPVVAEVRWRRRQKQQRLSPAGASTHAAL